MRKTLLKYGLLFSLLLLCGATLIYISHAVQRIEKQVTIAENQIEREEEAIRVLRAEWAYLNQPQRLERIAGPILGMQIPEVKNITQDPQTLRAQSPQTSEAASKAINISYEGAR